MYYVMNLIPLSILRIVYLLRK